MTTRLHAWLLATTITALAAGPAQAAVIGQLAPPVIDINGSTVPLDALNCSTQNNLVNCEGTNYQGSDFALDNWSMSMDPDPSITSNFTLTNISAVTQTFTMNVTLPTTTSDPAISITGYIGPGLLTDVNGGGATLADVGTAIYSAIIDGVVVRTLLDPPQLFSIPVNPFGTPGDTLSISQVSFGPDVLAQSVTSLIRIRYQFSLTAHDEIQWGSQFVVTPVPIPGALPLLGAALASLTAFRRRQARLERR